MKRLIDLKRTLLPSAGDQTPFRPRRSSAARHSSSSWGINRSPRRHPVRELHRIGGFRRLRRTRTTRSLLLRLQHLVADRALTLGMAIVGVYEPSARSSSTTRSSGGVMLGVNDRSYTRSTVCLKTGVFHES